MEEEKTHSGLDEEFSNFKIHKDHDETYLKMQIPSCHPQKF